MTTHVTNKRQSTEILVTPTKGPRSVAKSVKQNINLLSLVFILTEIIRHFA